jgi:hypothetical protein
LFGYKKFFFLNELIKFKSIITINNYDILCYNVRLPILNFLILNSQSIYKFLDEAENGVIVLSLGTNIKWKYIGQDKLNIIISALSKLKQRILWKIELELSDTMPKNIMTVKWLPQNDVLSTFFAKVWKTRNLGSTNYCIILIEKAD